MNGKKNKREYPPSRKPGASIHEVIHTHPRGGVSGPPKAAISDSPIRSIAKAISWRVTGTLDTILIAFIVTGKLTLSISIGLVEIATKTTLYYLHERLWDKIRLGKKTKPIDYQI